MIRTRITAGVAILMAGIGFGVMTGYAKLPPVVQGAPEKDKGVATMSSQSVNLQAEIADIGNRQLRLRVLAIKPGGHIKAHSHVNRPAIFYVIKGATTVVYGDGTVRRFTEGSMGYATRNTIHWHRNNGKTSVFILVADVFQPEKK